jgi:hypothetical protein
MDKQSKTAADLEQIVKVRMGAGDFDVIVQRGPDAGWHAIVQAHQPGEAHHLQLMADAIVTELCQHYDLSD